MKVVRIATKEEKDMNAAIKHEALGPNRSVNSSHGGASGGSIDNKSAAGASASSASGSTDPTTNQESTHASNINMEYLKNLTEVMTGQQGGGANMNLLSVARGDPSNGADGGSDGNGNASSNGNSDDFRRMQNAAAAAARDASLSDMLKGQGASTSTADQVNNLAMMSMLQQQQQQQQQMGASDAAAPNGMNWNFGNVNNNQQQQQQQQQHQQQQALNQLVMNGNMGNAMNAMNPAMSQQLKATAQGMMNGAMGGVWNAGDGGGGNPGPMGAAGGDPAFRNAFGMLDGVVAGANNGNGDSQQPLLIPPKKTKNKHKQTFAQKLMHILSMKDCQSAIRWMPNGCAFCIVDTKALMDNVLPNYFKEAKYTSFTRKLNRWGFKHFTLPTSEPSLEKEMSIYTHEKFLRDNPNLCQHMDGGHRQRSSPRDSVLGDSVLRSHMQDSSQSLFGEMGDAGMGAGQQDADASHQQLQQQQNIMIQQMQQLQQQNLMMQKMQQQVQQQQQQQQMNNTNQKSSGQNNPMFDMSNMYNMGGGGGGGGGSSGNNNFNPMNMFNNNNSNSNGSGNPNPSSMMGNNMNSRMDPSGSAAMGMRRTSLGFMPYPAQTNPRDSGLGGVSAVANDPGDAWGGARPSGGMDTALNDFGGSGVSSAPGTANGGPGGSDTGGGNQEEFQHNKAKLAVLEEMIAKERRNQSLLSSMDPDPDTFVFV